MVTSLLLIPVVIPQPNSNRFGKVPINAEIIDVTPKLNDPCYVDCAEKFLPKLEDSLDSYQPILLMEVLLGSRRVEECKDYCWYHRLVICC